MLGDAGGPHAPEGAAADAHARHRRMERGWRVARRASVGGGIISGRTFHAWSHVIALHDEVRVTVFGYSVGHSLVYFRICHLGTRYCLCLYRVRILVLCFKPLCLSLLSLPPLGDKSRL